MRKIIAVILGAISSTIANTINPTQTELMESSSPEAAVLRVFSAPLFTWISRYLESLWVPIIMFISALLFSYIGGVVVIHSQKRKA